MISGHFNTSALECSSTTARVHCVRITGAACSFIMDYGTTRGHRDVYSNVCKSHSITQVTASLHDASGSAGLIK